MKNKKNKTMKIDLANRQLKKIPTINPNAQDIRIENNQLTELPDSIGNLKFLNRIIANNNQISKISPKLAEIQNFTDLRLDENNLTKIPETIFNLKSLFVLYLKSNNIEKLSTKIGKLKQIKKLCLQNNKLKILPKEIGELKNLTHLYLANNPIEYLPHSIEKCTKLVHLDFSGTKLPLPPNYKSINVQANIKYILENQKEPVPELNIKKAFVFKNFSKTSLISKFDNILQEYSKEIEVEFVNINDLKSKNKELTVVLIIIGFDIHKDPRLVFNIIKKCKTDNISYKILFQKDIKSSDDIHIEKGSELNLLRKSFVSEFRQEINYFNSSEDLKSLIIRILKQHSPEVMLKSLHLENIGHFEKVDIDFDDKLTCIIGENGLGKSSILRALSLSIIGINNPKMIKDISIKNLLRIKSITNGQRIYNDYGKIILKYYLDAVEYCNEITFTSKDEGRIIDIQQSENDFELNYGKFNLKSLIVGFPQLRGRINQKTTNKYNLPHIDDLIPLVVNKDDSRLDSFIGWIGNLYGEAMKENNFKETREFSTIKYAFEVISALTGKEISFITMQQFTPPIMIISSPDAPNGISLNLISQGFKIVIGWIGYFIQRQIESFPLTSPYLSAKEKSILIIDEIDSSIHPVWQSRLLEVLQDKFPNTQIICTTHSPLMVAGLDKNQILQIENIDNKISVQQSNFDTWVTTYKDILKHIFNSQEYTPKITIPELEYKLENEENPEIKKAIKENIMRMIENKTYIDDLAKYEQKLTEKEKELDELIIEYSEKISN